MCVYVYVCLTSTSCGPLDRSRTRCFGVTRQKRCMRQNEVTEMQRGNKHTFGCEGEKSMFDILCSVKMVLSDAHAMVSGKLPCWLVENSGIQSVTSRIYPFRWLISWFGVLNYWLFSGYFLVIFWLFSGLGNFSATSGWPAKNAKHYKFQGRRAFCLSWSRQLLGNFQKFTKK